MSTFCNEVQLLGTISSKVITQEYNNVSYATFTLEVEDPPYNGAEPKKTWIRTNVYGDERIGMLLEFQGMGVKPRILLKGKIRGRKEAGADGKELHTISVNVSKSSLLLFLDVPTQEGKYERRSDTSSSKAVPIIDDDIPF